MRYLLDSHALLWATNGSSLMPASVRMALTAADAEVWYSPVVTYELGLQVTLRRLPPFPKPIRELATEFGFRELQIGAEHAAHAAQLPLIHRDPWDRIIAAQAIMEGMVVVTVDRSIAALGAQTLW